MSLIFHTVGRVQTAELQTFHRELRELGVVYSFATTVDLLAAWRIARANDATNSFTPTAVVWLQARPGEYRQREIDVVAECDPLARAIVVAGCYSEGEPRSGRPLTGAARIYWHQGAAAIQPLLSQEAPPLPTKSLWIAIHARQYVDYQALAAICQAAGHRTLWQNDAWPVISSEPAIRMFQGWDLWRNWRAFAGNNRAPSTKHLLLQDFPRPSDQEQAAREGIDGVLAIPCSLADLQRAIDATQRPIVRTLPVAEKALPASSSRPARRYLQSA